MRDCCTFFVHVSKIGKVALQTLFKTSYEMQRGAAEEPPTVNVLYWLGSASNSCSVCTSVALTGNVEKYRKEECGGVLGLFIRVTG